MITNIDLPDCDYLKEHEPVEVGKYYNVLCVVMEEFIHKYWPVLGHPHKDAQFGVDFLHIHYDGRFFPNGANYRMKNGITNDILSLEHDPKVFIVKRLKCLRLKTGINPPTNFKGIKYWSWYASMVGKSCKGKKCPHLGTTMHKRGNKLVCPLHNLTGCAKEEIIIDIKDTKKPRCD